MFNADTVGRFVPLAVLVTVEVIEIVGEEEVRTDNVSKTVNVCDDKEETLTRGLTVNASVVETVADGSAEIELISVDCVEILFNGVNVTTEDTVGEDEAIVVMLNNDKEVVV